MLIRQEQIEVFRRDAEAAFEHECCEHLCHYQPVLAEASGVDSFRAAVRSGLDCARRYDLYKRAAARLYLELMVTLGGSFDTDPQYAWLAPVISSLRELPPAERADLLYWHVCRYLEHTCGSSGEHATGVLRRLAELDAPSLKGVAEAYYMRAPAFIQWLHPAKLDFIGASTMAAFPPAALVSAEENDLALPEGAVLVLALEVTFGYAVLKDPIHAWTTRALDRAGRDPVARLDALLERTVALARQLGEL